MEGVDRSAPKTIRIRSCPALLAEIRGSLFDWSESTGVVLRGATIFPSICSMSNYSYPDTGQKPSSSGAAEDGFTISQRFVVKRPSAPQSAFVIKRERPLCQDLPAHSI